MPAHVLVIEDHPGNQALMTYLLEAAGYRVDAASDGETGFAAILADPPDIIVCDVRMPRMDGFALARRLKADPEYTAIPLIAVTAAAMVGDRETVLAQGFDGYIPKPIDPENFAAEIRAYLPSSDARQRADLR
jgi:two-component system cell cycle response regulator